MKKDYAIPGLFNNNAQALRLTQLTILQRERSKPHLTRKFYHCLMGLICFSLYAFLLTQVQAILVMLVVGGGIVILDIGRFYSSKLKELSLRYFGWLMRRNELKGLTANSYFVLGIFITLLFFPKPVTLMSVLFLAIGDPVAAIFGSLYGRTPLLGKKSLEGTLANFVICCLVGLVMGVFFFKLSPETAPLFAISCGVIAALSEMLPSTLDDNLVIPTASAVLLSVANHYAMFF